MRPTAVLESLKSAAVPLILATVLAVAWAAPLSAAEHSVARQWNEETLAAIRLDLARPTVHARNLYHTSVAMWDAWAAYDESAGQVLHHERAAAADIEAARAEAMSFAVYRLLRWRFATSPGAAASLASFAARMDELGYDRSFRSFAGDTPAALGNRIALTIIAHGLFDHANEAGEYANLHYTPVNPPLLMDFPGNPDLVDANRWQPLALEHFIDQSGNPIPGGFPDFLSPEWGRVKPFSLSPDDLTIYERGGFEYWVYHDPGPPPLADSAEYRSGFEQVVEWSGRLDPSDGVMIDISPASRGDNTLGTNDGDGHDLNPHTGLPYEPTLVPAGDYYRVLAEFWADGPDSETPPGHWFTIANYVADHPALEKRMAGTGPVLGDLEWDVKMYLALAGAMHDVAITAWGVKGWYDYIRPVSAIRHLCANGQRSDSSADSYSEDGINLRPGSIELVSPATTGPGGIHEHLAGVGGENIGKIAVRTWRGPDYIDDPEIDTAGVGWILCENWWPYQRPTFVTPPFAGYVSGHSAYSRAAAEVLTRLTGDPFFPGGLGTFEAGRNEFLVFEEGPSVDVALQWATYADAADETSISRIYGGIHPTADDIPGRLIGAAIGPTAFQQAAGFYSGDLGGTPSSAHLTLVKLVKRDDGGNATANEWLLSASGPTPISGWGGVAGEVAPGVYVLSESGGPRGYRANSWRCLGASPNGDQVTLTEGQSVVCAIKNNDDPSLRQFVDVTDSAQLTHTHSTTQTVLSREELDSATMDEVPLLDARAEVLSTWMTGAVAAGDYDGDGLPDLFAAGGDAGVSRLFRNLGDGTFEDKAAAAGVRLLGERTTGAVFADYDGDGDLDLLVGGVVGTSPHLFQNRGPNSEGETTFVDVFATALPAFDLLRAPNTFGGAFGDYDLDGDLDLFLPHSVSPAGPFVDSAVHGSTQHLWRNNGDGTFADVSDEAGISALFAGPTAHDETFTPIFSDLDEDGYPDLLIAADRSRSLLLINQRNGSFTDATDRALFRGVAAMGATVGDFDRDGHLDWFVSQIRRTSTRSHKLLRGHGDGTLTDVSTETGAGEGGHWAWGTCFADLNNDQHLDLVVVNGYYWRPENPYSADGRYTGTPAAVFLSNRDGTFAEDAVELGLADTGEGRGLSCFDYDRDGDVDVAISNHRGPFKLYRNNLAGTGGFVTARLAAPSPNTEGIGSWVRLSTENLEDTEPVLLVREVRAGSNFVSADLAEAHFGLGDWQGPFTLEVSWPGGQTTSVRGVARDTFVTIEQTALRLLNSELTFAEGDAAILEATATGLGGEDRASEIAWSLGGLDNVIASGQSFDASGWSTGTYQMFISVTDGVGTIDARPFTLTITPLP